MTSATSKTTSIGLSNTSTIANAKPSTTPKQRCSRFEKVRDDYAAELNKTKANLRTDGYDPAAIQALDGEDAKGQAPGDIPPSGREASELADINRVTNQAVVDQMAKVRAAQKAVDDAMATAYTHGQGSPEGQAALQSLPQLKKNLAAGNLFPTAVSEAESRAEAAAHNLAAEQAGHVPGSLAPGAADHPPPITTTDHPAPATTHDPVAGGDAHVSVPPLDEVPHPLPHDSQLFDGYHPIAPGPEFTRADGSLIYPDDSLPIKPYAIPGTVVLDAHLTPGTVIDRFGYPGGGYLCPDGVPFAERALPPESALKPYYQYVVEDPTALPPGWHIEESHAAPWFHQPGGGTQYRIIRPDGQTGSVEDLVGFGILRRVK